MSIEELPQKVTPREISKIYGIGINRAASWFHSKGFPRIAGTSRLEADKGNFIKWIEQGGLSNITRG